MCRFGDPHHHGLDTLELEGWVRAASGRKRSRDPPPATIRRQPLPTGGSCTVRPDFLLWGSYMRVMYGRCLRNSGRYWGRNLRFSGISPRTSRTPRSAAATTLLLVATLFATLVAAACADGAPEPSSEAPEWSLSGPLLSVGILEGDERYQFQGIGGAWMDSDGRLVVLDRGPLALRIFDSAGTYVRGFGPRGEGPGELAMAWNAFPYRGDSIAAFDLGNRRISVFDRDGTFGRSVPLTVQYVRRPGTIPSQSCCQIRGTLDDGSFLVHPPDDIPNEAGPPRHGQFSLLRLSADGADLDTLGAFASRRYSYDASRPNNIHTFLASHNFLYAPAGDVVIGGNGESNEVVLIRPGPPARPAQIDTLRLSIEPEPFTPAVREAIVQAYRDEQERRPETFHGDAQSYVTGESPDRIPAFSRLVADETGRLWARRWEPPFHAGPMVWRVFDTSGEQVARVRLPARSRLMWAGEDQILVLMRDEFDVERLELYRIETSVRRARPLLQDDQGVALLAVSAEPEKVH